MYYLSIVCARESIYIANPYFVPDPVAIETLIDAKRRGVNVRIMVSGKRNDNWLARPHGVRCRAGARGGHRILIQPTISTQDHGVMPVDHRVTTNSTTVVRSHRESNVNEFDRGLATSHARCGTTGGCSG